jgi:hypothetical protein
LGTARNQVVRKILLPKEGKEWRSDLPAFQFPPKSQELEIHNEKDFKGSYKKESFSKDLF